MLKALTVILEIQELDMKMIQLMQLKKKRQLELEKINSTKNSLNRRVAEKQTEILDLKTDYETKATGVVLESKIDIGRGPIASVIIISGTLKKGDYFVCGLKWGRVRALINDLGNNIEKALPASPVEILGINGAPKAGDDFLVLENEQEAKLLCEVRMQETKSEKNPLTFVTQESAFKDKASEELNIIIKSDVHGSSEAIKNAINQIKHDEVKPKIILADIGMVTEADIFLAKASNAVLIAFNIKPSKEAKKRAEQEKITISSYNIIYEAIDFIKKRILNLVNNAKYLFPELSKHYDEWLGFRPTLPDFLPVMGSSKNHKNLFYSFGHHHLGWTLGAISGKIISGMVAGDSTNLNLEPYSSLRFG